MKQGDLVYYLSNCCRPQQGIVEQVIGNKVKIRQCNYLVTKDRIVKTREQAQTLSNMLRTRERRGIK